MKSLKLALLLFCLSLSAFAFVEDFAPPEAQENMDYQLSLATIPFEKYQARLVVMKNDLNIVGSVPIMEASEIQATKDMVLKSMDDLLSFLERVQGEQLEDADKRFIAIAISIIKLNIDRIEKNRRNFGKFNGDLPKQFIAMNYWPADFVVFNPLRFAKVASLDSRQANAVIFHEFVHSYYIDRTKPLTGPDRVNDSSLVKECKYQESIAHAASVRLMRLYERFDGPVDYSISSLAEFNKTFGNPKEWAKVVSKYCGN